MPYQLLRGERGYLIKNKADIYLPPLLPMNQKGKKLPINRINSSFLCGSASS
jgi:hypothetical protein